MSQSPEDPLDALFDRWRAPDEPPAELRREVWHRINQIESGRRTSGSLWSEIDAWFARPPFAALFIACCALLGLFLAEVRVNRLQQERSAEIARSYLQLIDPLLTSAPPDVRS